MQKEFIPYEEALALKELGFDESCFTRYYESGKLADSLSYLHHNYFGQVNAPLYQQAFKWFREKHKLDSIIVPSGDISGKTNGYYYEIIFDFSKENIESNSYKNYEEAELACLRKLIEIVKK